MDPNKAWKELSKRPIPKEFSFQRLETLLHALGYRSKSINGSHHVFENTNPSYDTVTIPIVNGKYVKSIYIKNLIKTIEEGYRQGEEQ